MSAGFRIPLSHFALRVWLKRRERRLILEERAAVQAALDSATPEGRTTLEQLLAAGPHLAGSRCSSVPASRDAGTGHDA